MQVVAARCVESLARRGVRFQPDLEDRFRGVCLAAIDRALAPRDRLQLALALGHLGDPRVIDDLNDPKAYVEIPAGVYPLTKRFGKRRRQPILRHSLWMSQRHQLL